MGFIEAQMIVVVCSNCSHPLGPADLEEGGHVEGELDDRVVLAEAAAHLVPRAQVHDGLHLHVPRVPLDVGAAPAVAEVGVARLVEQGHVQRVLLVDERAPRVGAVVVHAVAPVDALRAAQVLHLSFNCTGNWVVLLLELIIFALSCFERTSTNRRMLNSSYSTAKK